MEQSQHIDAPVHHNPDLHELVWTLLKDQPRGTLLDLPSGPGYFAQRAGAEGFKAIAAEIDPALHVLPGVTYSCVDMARPFPFSDALFDYIVSIEGIEHTENQFLFLRECARVLKKGGRLFLTTPNVSALQSRLLFLLTGGHDNSPLPTRSDLPNLFMSHINLIPFPRLETFLRFSGLEIETLHPYKWRPVSRLLYPLFRPFMRLRYKAIFKRHHAGKSDEAVYRQLLERYLSPEVCCGEYHVLVARKN